MYVGSCGASWLLNCSTLSRFALPSQAVHRIATIATLQAGHAQLVTRYVSAGCICNGTDLNNN